MYINFSSSIAILNVHGADYCCIISGNSKSEALNSRQGIDFIEKGITL